ncbi:hypothetical protein [Lacticaseibacillus hulanensis]|uniref:hypothetical protein n=1 Tax=Lacticaseibacillus hulanensis TaxID=2493111 RepID=UPI000FD7498F|nr:hypothetical protein [Lacticaseibacillus hulanensis]
MAKHEIDVDKLLKVANSYDTVGEMLEQLSNSDRAIVSTFLQRLSDTNTKFEVQLCSRSEQKIVSLMSQGMCLKHQLEELKEQHTDYTEKARQLASKGDFEQASLVEIQASQNIMLQKTLTAQVELLNRRITEVRNND